LGLLVAVTASVEINGTKYMKSATELSARGTWLQSSRNVGPVPAETPPGSNAPGASTGQLSQHTRATPTRNIVSFRLSGPLAGRRAQTLVSIMESEYIRLLFRQVFTLL